MKTADVCIIGGGVVGASVAFHLAEAGCANVVVVERGAQQGAGSTGAATGGVRAQFATRVDVLMSLYSIEFLKNFEEATGGHSSSGYRPAGYLFFATDEGELDRLKTNVELQCACGLKNVEILNTDDIARLVPGLRADDILGGTFCQTDGFVSPTGIMRGFTERARERGVELWLDTTVSAIAVEDGAVSRVSTTRGDIHTRAVVNAAGAWAAEVARLTGVEIPVTPLRRQIVATKPLAELPKNLPMVIDAASGFHFRPDSSVAGNDGGFLLAWPDPEETLGFETDFDETFVPKILERARTRVPAFARAEVERSRCRAGLYEMTPDRHAIIGEAPTVRGLFHACGFSGHGVMHSPATGRAVSEMILHGASRTIDVSALGVERFAEGRLVEESSLI